jgi:polysaccharide deacetylase family protein (PEP-CTERM system associated)
VTQVAHALTIDVEDWFQVLNMQHVIARSRWEQMELRCADATRRLHELLVRRGARATFFFLGWIAERLPELVAELRAAGHEIGSHGYDHRLLDELGPDGFERDLERTETILAGITGAPPRTFRACTWSIGPATLWALPILARRGYRIDSSVFPARRPGVGMPGAPTSPYRIETGQGELLECPPLVLEALGGLRLAVGGGGWLRLFPLRLLEMGLRQQERRGAFGCIWLHPWEVDPGQPRQRLGGLKGLRHYVGLRRTLGKLDRLLARHHFVDLASAIAGASWAARCPALSLSELSG